MKYKVFLVDADDTLFDFQAAAESSLRRAFNECGLEYKEHYKSVYMRINEGLWKRLERREITKAQLLEYRFSTVLKELNIDYDDVLLNDAYVRALSDSAHHISGAREFLEELKSLGDIYIITNGTYSVQISRMKKFGMERYIKGSFISEKIGAEKPSEKFMQCVTQELAFVKKQEMLIIGDSLSSDVKLGENNGVDCVWFNPKNKPSGGVAFNYEAKTYGEILEIIKNS